MKKYLIILGIILGLGVMVGGYFIYLGHISVVLNGDTTINSTIGMEYNDLGFTIKRNNIELKNDKYSFKVNNNLDINTLGTYYINYKIKYLLNTYTLKRTVLVVDDIMPEITVNIDKVERDYCSKKDKVTLEYHAMDNYDGDLTEQIVVQENEEEINLSVSDSSNNIVSLSIPIVYTKKPSATFKLNGNSTVYVAKNTQYKESGAIYKDGCGNTLSNEIKILGSVDTTNIGEYVLTYTLNEKEKLTRKVIVYNPAVSENINPKEKVLYLTFDDGPGQYTQKILDTLAKYNIKATFFVTHQFGSYVPLIQKEYEQGHTVAAHSYSHNYNIYRSVEAYLQDFNKINDDIEKYTGKRSQLFRFPGGSSNTVSRNYAKGVVKAIASRMTEDGYVYFDWDVSSGDASGASRSKIYNNVVSGASWCKKCVILMHDIKYNTAYELDNILQTLTSKGYKFGTLNVSSPTAHHTIAN